MKVLGINNEVTTCECCGRTNLKRTVVLATAGGEVRYGTECAAKAMKCGKKEVEQQVRAAAEESARQAQAARDAEWEQYTQWLLKTYGDTKSNMERRRAWRAA